MYYTNYSYKENAVELSLHLDTHCYAQLLLAYLCLFVLPTLSLPTEQQLHVLCVICLLNTDVYTYALLMMVVNIHDDYSKN